MRQLRIDLSELEMAFDSGNETISFYLDLETGEVIPVSDEDCGLLEIIYASYYDEPTQTVDWKAAFQEKHIPNWQLEGLQNADRIEAGFGSRFIAIPQEGADVGYRDMEAFINTVSNRRLQEHLERALSGRGAFRSFKDVLLDYPAERERWFQLKQDRLHQRMLAWLDEQGITLCQ